MHRQTLSGEQVGLYIYTGGSSSTCSDSLFKIVRIPPDVKMLAVAVVLFLAAGLSDAVILTKCGLKQQLETGLSLTFSNSTDVLPQIVCHAQQSSGFNTSTIKTITEPEEHHGSRHRRSPKRKGKGRPSSNVTRPPHDSSEETEVWTLYGLFQLSDHVVCSSAQSGARNLCGLTCDKLTDDDTSDDIKCVQTLINALTQPIPDRKTAKHIREMLTLIYQPECSTIQATSYFADC